MPFFKHAQLPLRTLMLRRVGVLLAATTLLVAASFIGFGLWPMSNQVATDQFDLAAGRVESALAQVFTPPVQLLAMGRGWLGGQAPDLASAQEFNRVFKPVLQASPDITSVVVGTNTGQGWLLLQQGDDRWRNRFTDVPRWGKQQHRLLNYDADGTVHESWSTQLYDPRERPWFSVSMAHPPDGSVHWTAPYQFFTTGDPGITASTRMTLADGRDLVLGFDVLLRDLSRTTARAAVGKHGLAMVMTQDGLALSLPRPPDTVAEADWLKRVLKPVDELQLAPLTHALARWRDAGRPHATTLTFESSAARWLVSVRPYELSEQRLWVVVLAPANDFIPAWSSMAAALSLALALVVALALWLTYSGAARLSRPLEALATASRRIGQLDFDQNPHIASAVVEIAQLTISQQNMVNLLKENQHELDHRAEELSRQVASLKSTEQRLQHQNELFVTIIDNFPGGVSVFDDGLRMLAFNAQFKSLLELPDELLKRPNVTYDEIIRFNAQRGDYGPGDVEALVSQRVEQAQLFQPHHLERTLANGMVLDVRGAPLPQGGFVTLYMDVTATKRYEQDLERLAHFDALTGLPNRALLADRLRQAMPQALRRGYLLVLAFLDLDGFKAVNDSYGHAVGDQLLLTLSGRMKQTLREGDTLARLGGDEFVVVLMDMAGLEASMPLLDRLLLAVASPMIINGREVRVSASMGVTSFPQSQEVDAEQLLRQADQAMYLAKQAGKDRYHVFDAAQDLHLRGQFEDVQRLRQALTGNELVLYYQPKVNMQTAAVVGVEALIRWAHPQRGVLPPSAFLPLIEEHALAVDVGRWVIDTALTQMTVWQAAGLRMPVSVNVGARQLQQAGFVDDLRAALAAHPAVAAQDLQVEVLETSALQDIVHVTDVMSQCNAMGVQFALDDFGTGYSSLTYLKRLPANMLKIDQSFVRDMLDDADDLSILVGVLDLAKSFHRRVIAEGVETVAHGHMLLQLGCALAQGYGIARPMPAQDLPAWVANWRGHAQWQGVSEVARNDQALLFAAVDHRAWLHALTAYLQGECSVPPPLDGAQCRFGRWLAEGGLQGHVDTAVDQLSHLHQQLHGLAQHLCELQAQGQTQALMAQLLNLSAASDDLLAQLQRLLVEAQA